LSRIIKMASYGNIRLFSFMMCYNYIKSLTDILKRLLKSPQSKSKHCITQVRLSGVQLGGLMQCRR